MPRKKKITKKDVNDKKKDNEPVLDKLSELNLKLNLDNESSDLEENEEESKLEEDVDDSNLNLQSLEFHQFMELSENSADSGTPVLERMALSAPRPIFVGGIPRDVSTAETKESGGEFKYVSGNADTGEPKYFSEPGIGNMPERVDLMKVGRTGSFREEISQERFFTQSEPKIESQSMERFERPERFDIEQAGRRNPSEREERKYRPKLPKS